MEVRIKRAYDPPADTDGVRILVDRLWPRGISKEKARIDSWPKELTPRTGFGAGGSPELVQDLLRVVREGTVTFVYSSKERHLNNAVALKEYVETLTQGG